MIFQNITITNIDHFALIPINSGETRKVVNRPNFGLLFSPSGKTEYIQNGVKHINDNNHVLLLPEKGTYNINCIEGDICPLINFTCRPAFSEIISLKVNDSQKLLSRFEDFSKAWFLKKNDIYYPAMAYFYEILAELRKENPMDIIETPRIISEAEAYIEQNYQNCKLTADMIAKELHISTVYFRKLFYQYYNVPPMKYINDMRISLAKALLQNQISSIEQIAECSGFSSIYTFSRAFKNATGTSPSEYKKMYRAPVHNCGKNL